MHRYGRGVKTLQDLLKRGRSGFAINMDDVPPALAPSTQQIPSLFQSQLTIGYKLIFGETFNYFSPFHSA